MPVLVDRDPPGADPIVILNPARSMVARPRRPAASGREESCAASTKSRSGSSGRWPIRDQSSAECGHFRRGSARVEATRAMPWRGSPTQANRLYGGLEQPAYRSRYVAGGHIAHAYPWTVGWKAQGQDIEICTSSSAGSRRSVSGGQAGDRRSRPIGCRLEKRLSCWRSRRGSAASCTTSARSRCPPRSRATGLAARAAAKPGVPARRPGRPARTAAGGTGRLFLAHP